MPLDRSTARSASHSRTRPRPVEGLRRGEPIFERFNNGKAKVEYWRRIAEAAHQLLGDESIVAELDAAVTEAEAFAPGAKGPSV